MKPRPNAEYITESPLLVIDAGLAPGRHRFRLVVETAGGRRSQPAEVIVTVLPAPGGIPRLGLVRKLLAWLLRVLAGRRNTGF